MPPPRPNTAIPFNPFDLQSFQDAFNPQTPPVGVDPGMTPTTPPTGTLPGQSMLDMWKPMMQGTQDLHHADALDAMARDKQKFGAMQDSIGAIKMHPPTRHLGMSGEDITGQTGPYDSGGIDWLKSHRVDTPAFDPQAAANTAQARQAIGNLPHVQAQPSGFAPDGPPSVGPEWGAAAGGGQEAQINPHALNPFANSNYMTINGGLSANQTGPRRGGIIGDEKGPQYRAPSTF